jgi:PAS domain S-box-containing protein
MKKIDKSDEAILCQEAERLIKGNSRTTNLQLSDSDIQKMIFDLQQHQVELELQNEELLKAKQKADSATQKYAELYDFAPSGYFTLSREGVIKEINLCGSQMLGKNRSQLKNSLFINYISDVNKTDFRWFLGQVFDSRTKVSCETLLSLNNESTIYVQLTGIFNEKGEQCQLTAIDISNYKAAEARLTESREFYSDLVSNQSAGVYRLLIPQPHADKSFVDSMSMEYVSARFCEIVEINPATVLKDTNTAIFNRIHPDDIHEFTRLNEIAQHALNPFVWKGRLLIDERIKWVRFDSSPRKLESGCIRWTGMVIDITKQKTAEEELRKVNELHKVILMSATDGFCLLDTQGQLLEVNDSYCRMSGYSEKELLNMNIKDLELNETSEHLRSHFQRIIDHGSDRFESRNIRKDGSVFDVELSIQYRSSDNGQFVVFIKDITERKAAEEGTHLAHSRLRRFIDSDIVGIVIATCDGGLIEANDYYLNLIGYSRAEFNSNQVNWREITAPEWLPADENSILELREKGASKPYLKEYLRRDGTKVTVLIADTLLPGPDEQIAGFILDITEQKRTEEAVVESELRLNKSQKMAHLGSWDLNIQSGELIWSDEVYRIFGLQPQECAATLAIFMEIIHPDDRNLVLAAFYGSIERNKDGYEIEHRIIRSRTGEVRIVYEKCEHIRDISGLIIRSMGMVQDVTEFRKATEELKRSEEKYRLLAENISDVIWIFNVNYNRFTYISPSVFQLRGITDAEAMAEGLNDSIAPEAVLKLNAKIPARICDFQNGIRKNYTDQFPQLCKDGNFKWVETVSEYLYAKDGTIEVQGVSRDISERKLGESEIKLKNEELHKLNAEKDKFFSIIAHDLRSPFSGFLGLTELMAEGLPRMTLDEIQKLAFLMRNSAANLFRLLGNLLEWSRMQRGLTSFIPATFLLMPKITESMVLVLESARNKEIEIDFDIPDDFSVIADGNMLDSIFRNLVSNAVKFTPKQGRITVSAMSIPDNGVAISIKDSGIGMNKKMIDHLFLLDVNKNRKGTEGEYSTGLGLIICKDFIEKHGGRLWVESEVGKGSTFHFSLPKNPAM